MFIEMGYYVVALFVLKGPPVGGGGVLWNIFVVKCVEGGFEGLASPMTLRKRSVILVASCSQLFIYSSRST